MKILAIRGKNLASLAGEFEIPFQQEPLKSAGLFAISGPTGAGKSTLLDALCLALYDDTPRLLKAGSAGTKLPDVAGESVTPHDSRTLLRRGAAEGYAEVDFVGNDGREYRARWSVRRSRIKSDGKLQAISMSLKSLPDEQPIGGNNKGEVKAEIAQRIGLNFEQFTRSVLLAQNEFSTFLKADDNERGELLETLTGIAIYTDISKRAFEREKLERAALQRLNDRLADQKPLSHELRLQLEQDSQLADAALAALELRKKILDEHLRWHEVLGKTQHSEKLAQEAWQKSLGEQQAAASRRTDFERIESVQAARPLLGDCERIKADMARSQLAISSSEAELGRATLALQAANETLELARHALSDAEQRQAAAAPDLDLAKALDTQLETLLPLHQQAGQTRDEACAAETQAQQALSANEQQQILANEAQQKSDEWLTQNAHLAVLAEGWPRWDVLFKQASQLALEQTQLKTDWAKAQQGEASLLEAGLAANAAFSTAAQVMEQAETRRAALQKTLDEFDVAARLVSKQSAEYRRDLLVSAGQQWRELSGELAEQTKLQAEVQQRQEAVQQADAALVLLNERLPVANAELAQAERSLKTAEAACAENVETLRAALEENEACPVCGAKEHPYRSEKTQLHAVLEGLQAGVGLCRERVRQLQEKHITHSTRAADGRSQLENVSRQLEGLEESIQRHQSAWASHSLASELRDIETGERARWMDEQQQAVRVQLQTIADEEKAERAAALARDKAQAECDKATKQHAAGKEAATSAQAALEKTRSELTGLAQKLAETTQRLEGTLDELDAAFENKNWIEAWRKTPQAFHAQSKTQVGQWQTQSKSRDERQALIVKLVDNHAALLEALDKASAQASRTAAVFADSSTQIEKIQTARGALFEGKPISQIQSEFNDAMASAKNKFDGQREQVQQLGNAKTRQQEARDQAINRHAEQQKFAESADAALMDWLSQYNESHSATPINTEQLRALLAHTAEWLGAERKHLLAIDSALQKAATVLQERTQQRKAHEQNRPTTESAEAITQALSQLEVERQAAQAEATKKQLEVAQDQARRQQSASMLAEIEQQDSTHRIWAQLSELIGSADGKKFRNYAQQFTLDVLLGYANQHLAELSRRYRLERIKDSLALMVVDQDMGDELRSVHSLSGGESFLVSLALALGLASLSSNRVRVESLFIDEGFGSLDPETLSVALDALDGLQAMGRKVGVISHVQEMTERISTRILVQRLAGGKSQLLIS